MRRTESWMLVLFCCLFLLTACQTTKPNRENQWQVPFSAKIEGTRGQLAFCADITVTATERTICYTAPKNLAGLTVTENAGGICIRQGEFEIQNQPDAKDLLAPLNLLIAPAELASVQEKSGEKTLTYADGVKLILQKDGSPRAVIGADLFFTISSFTKLS